MSFIPNHIYQPVFPYQGKYHQSYHCRFCGRCDTCSLHEDPEDTVSVGVRCSALGKGGEERGGEGNDKSGMSKEQMVRKTGDTARLQLRGPNECCRTLALTLI